MLSDVEIEENYKRFISLCTQTGERSSQVEALINHFGERLVIAPGSSRVNYHDAWPGGLVDHSLKVLQHLTLLCKLNKVDVTRESLIIVGLFHDIGKVGDLNNDYYLPQDNAWRRDNLGEMYTHNYSMQKMSVTDRSLWLMQHFKIDLDIEEWLAIKLNDGMYVQENKEYAMHEPTLALLLHQADRWVCQVAKTMTT